MHILEGFLFWNTLPLSVFASDSNLNLSTVIEDRKFLGIKNKALTFIIHY